MIHEKLVLLAISVKNFAKLSEKKILFENFISLSTLQVINYILPLITIPYLVRILGPEKFGLIAFSQSFIQFFSTLTDYGFNLSATRKISIYRGNRDRVSEIFSSVLYIKFSFLLVSFLVLVCLVFAIPKFSTDWIVYLFAFGMVIGNVLFPVWFFQGMERMKYITFLNFLAKAIFTAAIFIFIRKQTDYLYVPLINSLGFIVAGILGLWLVRKDFKVKLRLTSLNSLTEELKEGWHIFISTISATIYINSNVFLLGILTNNTYVGYYSAGEKIIRAATAIFSPASTAIFPFISKKFSENTQNGLKLFYKLLKIISLGLFIFSMLIFLFAKELVYLILGNQYVDTINVVKILSVIPLFGIIGSLFAYHLFMNIGLTHLIYRILIVAFAINIILNVILIPPYKHIGASIAIGLTEVFVPLAFALSFYFLYFKKKEFHNE